MNNIIPLKQKKKIDKNENKSIHKLNIKLDYMANLTDLINEADNEEFDDKLYEGITHKVNSNKGNRYIITLTKVKP